MSQQLNLNVGLHRDKERQFGHTLHIPYQEKWLSNRRSANDISAKEDTPSVSVTVICSRLHH